MNNWHPHTDYSHPNWTGKTKRMSDDFYSPAHDPAPAKWKQAGIGILAAAAFILACWI